MPSFGSPLRLLRGSGNKKGQLLLLLAALLFMSRSKLTLFKIILRNAMLMLTMKTSTVITLLLFAVTKWLERNMLAVLSLFVPMRMM